MQEAEYGMTEQAHNLNAPSQGRFIGDEHLLVKFYFHPRRDQAASEEAGRPIFVDKEYVSIRSPGNKDSEISRPARVMDKERFPRHYAAFKNKQEVALEGTPLEEWPLLTKSMVQNFKHMNIMTVEALANTSDANLQGMMGAVGFKTKANTWLAATGDTRAANEMQAKLEERDDRIAALEAKIDALLVEEVEEDKPAPRRRRKAATG